MEQSFAGNTGTLPKTKALEQTLSRASFAARDYSHRVVTVEHLLFSLIDDPDADDVLAACDINVARLKNATIEHLIHRLASLRSDSDVEPFLSSDFENLISKASAAAEQAFCKELNGAMVLIALIGQRDSAASQLLHEYSLSFDVAVAKLRFVDEQSARRFASALQPEQGGQPGGAVPSYQSQPRGSGMSPTGGQPGSHSENQPPVESGIDPFANEVAVTEERDDEIDLSKKTSLPPPVTVPDLSGGPAPDASKTVAGADREEVSVDDLVSSVKDLIGEGEDGSQSSGPQSQPMAPPVADDAPLPPGNFPGSNTVSGGTEFPGAPIPSAPARIPSTPQDGSHSAPNVQAAPVPAGARGSAGVAGGFGSPQTPGAQPGVQRFPAGPPGTQPVAAPRSEPERQSLPGGSAWPSPPAEAPPIPASVQLENRRRQSEHDGMPSGGKPVRPDMREMAAPAPVDTYVLEQADARRKGVAGSNVTNARAINPSGRSRLEAALAGGALAENIPRQMRSFVARDVEVRIAKADVVDLDRGMSGAPTTHAVTVSEAMSVQLRAPQGGFTIENAAPETQWIGVKIGQEGKYYGRWRWTVTPTARGRKRLQLVISARTVDENGLVAETPMPEQIIMVDVKINYTKSVQQLGGWLAAALAGGVVAHYGGALVGLFAL